MMTNDAKLRVIDEVNELELSLSKLNDFISTGKIKSLRRKQRQYLRRQQKLMREYIYILHMRLIHWED